MKSGKFRYWLFLIVIGCVYLYWSLGSNQINLQMTSQQAQVTRSAVSLVISQIESGKLDTYSSVIDALYAELPTAVRDSFVANLDGDFSTIIPQLKSIADSIQVTE